MPHISRRVKVTTEAGAGAAPKKPWEVRYTRPFLEAHLPKLTPSAFVVYTVLMTHARADGTGAYPSQVQIARFTKLHRDTVASALKELEKHGFVEVPPGPIGSDNPYYLPLGGSQVDRQPSLFKGTDGGKNRQSDAEKTGGGVRKKSASDAEKTGVPISNEPQLTSPNEPEPPNPPRGERAAEEEEPLPGFEEFWREYPRKLNRQRAVREWNQLQPDPGTVQAIFLAVPRNRISGLWTREGGRFIPSPGRFLRERRWKDDPSPKGGNQSERTKYRYPEPP